MIRQRLLWRVLGRRLTERLIHAGRIVPVHTKNRAIFFSARDIHRALSRVQREGYLIDGRVASASVSASAKVRKRSTEDPLAGIELDNLFPE